MSYVRDMLNREEANTKELEEILNNENIKKIVLRANKHLDNDTILSLRGTKALVLEDMSNTDKEYDNRTSWGELLLSAHDRPMGINVTTWSSLIRNAVDVLKPQISFVCSVFPDADEFKATFNDAVKNICEEIDFKLNSNCPRRLFKEAEETDLIHSTVYMSNKNHFIPIITDENGIVWGFCAVYTGEVIVMLEALLDTIYTLTTEYTQYQDNKDEFPHHTMVITYINREDIVDGMHRATAEELNEIDTEVASIDEEMQKLEMTKDLIKVQSKLMQITTLVQQVYADVNDIQEKYNLPTVDDILGIK